MGQHIVDVLTVRGCGAYFNEDLVSLHRAGIPVKDRYTTPGVTAGFDTVRQPASTMSVGLVLADGRVAWGDCAGITFSSVAGRQPAPTPAALLRSIQQVVTPQLRGRALENFRECAQLVCDLTETVEQAIPLPQSQKEAGGRRKLTRRNLLTLSLGNREDGISREQTRTETVAAPLHPAVTYGVSQALLAAHAMAKHVTMAEILSHEYKLNTSFAPVPLDAQCGSDWYDGADKMIVRRIASLPHALVDDIPRQLGQDGRPFITYVSWLRDRIVELSPQEYRPVIHLDFHGALGTIYDNNPGKILGFLTRLSQAADPFIVRVESPVVRDSRDDQIEALRQLRQYLTWRHVPVQLVADEWANTLVDIRQFLAAGAVDMIHIKMPDVGSIHHSVEAVTACHQAGTMAFLGGSCAETDLSSRTACHVALAAQPDLMLAKPGMGVDEAISITHNEMARTQAEILARAMV